MPVRGLGKRWRGRDCVYCVARKAEGGDHVFARAFFPNKRRANLPQAPACNPCAGRKARIENELAATLAFAGAHLDALALLNSVPQKVAQNARLQRQLEQQGVKLSDDGTIDLTQVEALEFDGDPLIGLFEMIVRGLYFHHWDMYLAPEFEARAVAIPSERAAPALDIFRGQAGAHVKGNIGSGAFLYQGVRVTDNPNASLWRFQILGGVRLTDKTREQRVLDEFLVSTLRREFWDRIAAE